MISLEQYTERSKEGQKSIYYIAADSLAAAASAPFVEQLIKKDLEVGPYHISNCLCLLLLSRSRQRQNGRVWGHPLSDKSHARPLGRAIW